MTQQMPKIAKCLHRMQILFQGYFDAQDLIVGRTGMQDGFSDLRVMKSKARYTRLYPRLVWMVNGDFWGMFLVSVRVGISFDISFVSLTMVVLVGRGSDKQDIQDLHMVSGTQCPAWTIWAGKVNVYRAAALKGRCPAEHSRLWIPLHFGRGESGDAWQSLSMAKRAHSGHRGLIPGLNGLD